MFEGSHGFIPQWWHWLAAGLCLVMLELFIPAFFIIWFGAGAIALALLLLIVPDIAFSLQLFLWTCLSSALTVLWFRYFKNRTMSLVGSPTAQVIGEVGILVNALTPHSRGHVRFQKPVIGAEVWECYADEEIAADTRVRIVAVEGSFIKVEKTGPAAAAGI